MVQTFPDRPRRIGLIWYIETLGLFFPVSFSQNRDTDGAVFRRLGITSCINKRPQDKPRALHSLSHSNGSPGVAQVLPWLGDTVTGTREYIPILTEV